VKIIVILLVAQLVTTFIFFLARDNPRVKWYNSRKPTQKMRTLDKSCWKFFWMRQIYIHFNDWKWSTDKRCIRNEVNSLKNHILGNLAFVKAILLLWLQKIRAALAPLTHGLRTHNG
jgi:hypothetical protein